MKRILGTVLAGLMLTACSGPDPSPQATALGVKDCGTFNLAQGEELPESAARCLAEAAEAGKPARLKATRLTTEGDPIPVTYTAGTDGRVEVITDSRQDAFGEPAITRQFCTGPVAGPELDFAECSEAE